MENSSEEVENGSGPGLVFQDILSHDRGTGDLIDQKVVVASKVNSITHLSEGISCDISKIYTGENPVQIYATTQVYVDSEKSEILANKSVLTIKWKEVEISGSELKAQIAEKVTYYNAEKKEEITLSVASSKFVIGTKKLLNEALAENYFSRLTKEDNKDKVINVLTVYSISSLPLPVELEYSFRAGSKGNCTVEKGANLMEEIEFTMVSPESKNKEEYWEPESSMTVKVIEGEKLELWDVPESGHNPEGYYVFAKFKVGGKLVKLNSAMNQRISKPALISAKTEQEVYTVKSNEAIRIKILPTPTKANFKTYWGSATANGKTVNRGGKDEVWFNWTPEGCRLRCKYGANYEFTVKVKDNSTYPETVKEVKFKLIVE